MKRYVVTDGRQYYRKDHKGKGTFTSCHSLADELTLTQAKNVISSCINKNLRKRFYLQDVDPDGNEKIKSNADIRKEIKEIKFDKQILDEIDKLFVKFTSFDLPDLSELYDLKENLYEAQSYFDMVNSDAYHFMKDHKPAAHIRTKVYGIVQEQETIRTSVKEKIRYINILISSQEEEWSIKKLNEKLREAKEVPYQGRTVVWDELMRLIS